MLVEKDKNQLLEQYRNMGNAALEHCKDKFLVQSVAVTAEEAENLKEYEQLTALWTRIQASTSSSGGGGPATANKKLHVRHRVAGGGASGGGVPVVAAAPPADPESLSQERLVAEYKQLRRKYDELVSFSVNLTAERDILNNTLEQTKRDLSRELAKGRGGSVAGAAGARPGGDRGGGGGTPFPVVFLYLVMALLLGAKLQQMGILAKFPGFHGGDGDEGSGSEL